MILDFHTHAYPEALCGRVIENSAQLGVRGYTDASAAGLKRSMQMAGITHSVILNIATKPRQSAHIIDSAYEMQLREQHNPTQRLIPLPSIYPFEEAWRDNLHRVKKLGFAGIKLHPDYQGFYIDDPRLEPLYREVAALDLLMVFHAGFDVVSPDNTHATARRIHNVLPLLEKATTVLAHMGGYRQEQETLALLCGRDVFFDTSFNLPEIDIETARAMFRKHSPARILFGTDSPWRSQRESVDYFCQRFAPGFLSPADTANVLWNNGARLLGLPLDMSAVSAPA